MLNRASASRVICECGRLRPMLRMPVEFSLRVHGPFGDGAHSCSLSFLGGNPAFTWLLRPLLPSEWHPEEKTLSGPPSPEEVSEHVFPGAVICSRGPFLCLPL